MSIHLLQDRLRAVSQALRRLLARSLSPVLTSLVLSPKKTCCSILRGKRSGRVTKGGKSKKSHDFVCLSDLNQIKTPTAHERSIHLSAGE